MIRFAFLFVIVIACWNLANGQSIRNASGMAQLRQEENMSKEDLKEQLRHAAIINAIEREYGTYVSQESFIDIDDGNTQFKIFGKTVIMGEWLKTTREDFQEEIRKVKDGKRNRNELWMTLKIQGMVREMTQPDIELDFFTSNCRKPVCKTSIFENGEPVYLHFRTPLKGYLSVYAIEDERAYRLLPYQNMPATYTNSVPVESDRDYVFFAPYGENDYFPDFSRLLIDELIMVIDKDQEFIQFVLIFSTEEFLKPGLADVEADLESGYEIPKSLPAADLNNWLESNRINNVNFYYKQIKVKIVK